MSDNNHIDFEWLLPDPPLDYHLPPSISDPAIWTSLPDIDIIPDTNKHLPMSTVTDPNPPAVSPATTTHLHPEPDHLDSPPHPSPRPPLAPIPANPHLANPLRLAPASKPLTKRPKSAKPTVKRSPRLAKLEHHPTSPNAPSKSPKRAPDESRQRHNQMMRANRHRFNNKFKELTSLLDTYKDPSSDYKPMKNKIQILDRAIYQYAQMQTKRARFESELTFCPDHPHPNNDYLNAFLAVPSLPHACNLVLEYMCATMQWKYAEAWLRRPARASQPERMYELAASVVSKNNMPDTRHRLARFAERAKRGMDAYLLALAKYRHPVWIPDLSRKTGRSSRAAHAKDAHVTTMVAVPIFLANEQGLPDAIITLMHVNDELLSYARDERPYDSNTMTKLLDLVNAVVKSRAKTAC